MKNTSRRHGDRRAGELHGGRREIPNPEITGALEEDRDGAGESKDGADPGRNSLKGVKPGS